MNTVNLKNFLGASLILPCMLIPIEKAHAVDPIATTALAITIANEIKALATKDSVAQVRVTSKTDGPDGDDKAVNGDFDKDNWIWEGSLDTTYTDARAEAAQVEHHFAGGELHYKFTSGKGWMPNLNTSFANAWRGNAVAYPDSTPVAGSDNKTEAATIGAFLYQGAVTFSGYKDESGRITEITNSPNSGHRVVIGQRYTPNNFIIENSSSGKKGISYANGDQTIQHHNSTFGWNGASHSYSNVAPDLASVAGLSTELGVVDQLADSIESEFDSDTSGLNGASPGNFMTLANIASNFTSREYDDTFTDQQIIEMYLTDSLGIGSGASSGYSGPSFLTTQLLEVGDSFDTSSLLSPEELEVASFISGCEDLGAGQAEDICFWAVTDENLFVNSLNDRLAIGSGEFFDYISSLDTGPSNPFTLELNYGTADSFSEFSSNVAVVPEPSALALMFTGLGITGLIAHRRRKQTA